MKFINSIRGSLKAVKTVTIVIGSLLAALTAFSEYWEKNDTQK